MEHEFEAARAESEKRVESTDDLAVTPSRWTELLGPSEALLLISERPILRFAKQVVRQRTTGMWVPGSNWMEVSKSYSRHKVKIDKKLEAIVLSDKRLLLVSGDDSHQGASETIMLSRTPIPRQLILNPTAFEEKTTQSIEGGVQPISSGDITRQGTFTSSGGVKRALERMRHIGRAARAEMSGDQSPEWVLVKVNEKRHLLPPKVGMIGAVERVLMLPSFIPLVGVVYALLLALVERAVLLFGYQSWVGLRVEFRLARGGAGRVSPRRRRFVQWYELKLATDSERQRLYELLLARTQAIQG